MINFSFMPFRLNFAMNPYAVMGYFAKVEKKLKKMKDKDLEEFTPHTKIERTALAAVLEAKGKGDGKVDGHYWKRSLAGMAKCYDQDADEFDNDRFIEMLEYARKRAV